MREVKVVVALCRELEPSATPAPLPRHVVVPLALCEELEERQFSLDALPPQIVEALRKRGEALIEDPRKAKELLRVDPPEGSYVRVYLRADPG